MQEENFAYVQFSREIWASDLSGFIEDFANDPEETLELIFPISPNGFKPNLRTFAKKKPNEVKPKQISKQDELDDLERELEDILD